MVNTISATYAQRTMERLSVMLWKILAFLYSDWLYFLYLYMTWFKYVYHLTNRVEALYSTSYCKRCVNK